jgi:hypothetical protein
MPTSAHGPPDLVAAARRITAWVRLRAEFHEAVGIAQVWGDEGPVHALTYSARHSATECTAEAARVRAIVDAAADNRADPDWRD